MELCFKQENISTFRQFNFILIQNAKPDQGFYISLKACIGGPKKSRLCGGSPSTSLLGAGVLGDGQFTGGDGGPLIVVPGGDSLEEFLIATTLEEIPVSGDGFVSRPCR